MDDKIKTLRDALEWLDRRIREEAELDGEMSNDHAIQLGFITNMLEKFPLRNCDVGTAEEQFKRYLAFCHSESRGCEYCPANRTRLRGTSNCDLAWAQMPYEAQQGGAE